SGGLTPPLSLDYNSQAGEGDAGWGWNVGGLSSITRCPHTIDDDGSTEGVALLQSDDYCLDGQRLRVTNDGTSGGNGTVYDTELRQFARIKWRFQVSSATPEYPEGRGVVCQSIDD
ncbi:MAG: SpvB/TcaC N-terminal domain-containing protein, partial [Gammaproteobacteria bacterium]